MTTELTPTQKKKLKGLAHHLKPVVLIGQHGVNEKTIGAFEQALLSHELIKVKFNEFKETKKELLEQISQQTGAKCVGLIGNIGILYCEHPDVKKRKIVLDTKSKKYIKTPRKLIAKK